MFNLIEYQDSHLDMINLRRAEGIDYRVDRSVIQMMIKHTGGDGLVMTIEKDGVILGIAGYYPIWVKGLEVWVIPAEEAFSPMFRISYIKAVKTLLQNVIKVIAPVRIQLTAIADETHDRWCSWLGFTKEGTMRKFSPSGATYNLWARVI